MAQSTDIDGARRVRLTLHVYDPATRQYRSSLDLTARMRVRRVSEVRRLWRLLIAACESGEWRDDRLDPHHGDRDLDVRAPASVG